ncbi:MAG: hypothetical protein AAF721_14940 [Myxococcota bacterium]
MPRRAALLSLLLAAVGCSDDKEQRPSPAPLSSPVSGSGERPKVSGDKAPDLIPRVEMAALGDRPGYVDGGLLYFAINVGETQRFWDSLPKSSDMDRDGRQAEEFLGFNPLADDWGKHFHVADDAVLSATILRPIDEGIGPLRATLKGTADGVKATLTSTARDTATSLGYHSRIHIPSAEPAKTIDALAALFKGGQAPGSASQCAAFEVTRCFVVFGGGIFLLRDEGDAAVIDMIVWKFSDYAFESLGIVRGGRDPEHLLPGRIAVVNAVLDVKTSVVPHAADLAGDAAMWLDPGVLARLAAIDRMRLYDEYDSPSDQFRRLERIENLAKAKRLFPGLALSFDYVDSVLHAEAVWPVAGALWGRMAVRAVSTPASSAPVPTTAALCAGSVACFRMQALPDLRSLSKTLVSEGFAADFQEVVRALERDEEYSWTLLAGGAWPNLLAAVLAAPDSLSGPEAGIASTVRDAVLRADGFGGVLRSYTMRDLFRFEGDYAVYARAAKQDVDAAKGLLGLSGEKVRDIELPDGRGRATTLQVDRRPEAHAYLQTGDAFGWAAVAPDVGAFADLLGKASETPVGPMAYVELPDLLRVFEPGAGGELDFARAWARGRNLRFVLELDAGAPRIRAAMGRGP